jgi:hypothetical protein
MYGRLEFGNSSGFVINVGIREPVGSVMTQSVSD